jgi:hypothetical protein
VHIHRDKFLFLNEKRYDILAVDVDDVEDMEEVEAGYEPGLDPATFTDVPMPNYSVCSGRGHYQAMWILQDPLPPRPSPKSVEFLSDVRDGLNMALNGDFAFNMRGAARNPFCTDYKARRWHGGRYSLEELNLGNPLFKQVRTAKHTSDYQEGNRNRATFLFALSLAKQDPTISMESLLIQVEFWQQAHAPEKPLSRSENAAVVKSALRNGYRYKIRADFNYGAMNLPALNWAEMTEQQRKDEIHKRQRQGALWVAEQKTATTTDKILKAVLELEAEGLHPTQAKIAEKSGLSLRTVKTYWNKRKI